MCGPFLKKYPTHPSSHDLICHPDFHLPSSTAFLSLSHLLPTVLHPTFRLIELDRSYRVQYLKGREKHVILLCHKQRFQCQFSRYFHVYRVLVNTFAVASHKSNVHSVGMVCFLSNTYSVEILVVLCLLTAFPDKVCAFLVRGPNLIIDIFSYFFLEVMLLRSRYILSKHLSVF